MEKLLFCFKKKRTNQNNKITLKISDDKWNERFGLIKSFDKTEFGWISKAAKLTGLSKRQIQRTCDHFNVEWRTMLHLK